MNLRSWPDVTNARETEEKRKKIQNRKTTLFRPHSEHGNNRLRSILG